MPGGLPAWVLERAQEHGPAGIQAWESAIWGASTFRVADDGQVYFIEDQRAPLARAPRRASTPAAALEGLHNRRAAGERWWRALSAPLGPEGSAPVEQPPPRRGPLRVGFTYNVSG